MHHREEKKEFQRFGHRPHTHQHPQNDAFVSDNVAFCLVSTARPPNCCMLVTPGTALANILGQFELRVTRWWRPNQQ